MKQLYYSLPFFLKNITVSTNALFKKRKKYGACFSRTLDYLTNTPAEEYTVRANIELERFLKKIKVNNNFYQVPNDLDLKKMPILTKRDVLKNYMHIFTDKPYVVYRTSGTTGQPLAVPYSKEAYQKEYAFWWYHRSFGGVKMGDRVATFAGHKICHIERKEPPFWVMNYPENQLIFSSYHMSFVNLKYYVKQLNRFRPVLIHGYPSSIYLVAKYILENDIQLSFQPKMVITASETTLDFQRKSIEEAFDCKIYVWYGNTELCGHITECSNGKLHIQPYHSYVRIINDQCRDADLGQEGYIVGTNFTNTVFPLINYNVGDVVRISKNQCCSCGKDGQIIDYIIGRIEDYIILPDGRLIGRLDHLFKNAGYVRNAQIEQNKLNEITLRIVKESGYDILVEKRILQEATNRLGHKMHIVFEYVKEIPKDKNGKYKFVIQNYLRGRGQMSSSNLEDVVR